MFNQVKKSFVGWAFRDFPTPRIEAVPEISADEIELAIHYVDSAEWHVLHNGATDEQVCLQEKEAHLLSLTQLKQVTEQLRRHDWYILNQSSVEAYQTLATRIGFFGRFRLRFMQLFGAVERTMRHRTVPGIVSAWFMWFAITYSIWCIPFITGDAILGEVLSRMDLMDFIFMALMPLVPHVMIDFWIFPFNNNNTGMTDEEVMEESDEEFRRVGRAYATLSFAIFLFIPTVFLALMWTIVSSPFKGNWQNLRHYREIAFSEFAGVLPQNVQDIAYGLGKTIPELSFSLEVLEDKLSRQAPMADDPFFICRYGKRPGEKLYLWHELAV
jgi:hypothetical protein